MPSDPERPHGLQMDPSTHRLSGGLATEDDAGRGLFLQRHGDGCGISHHGQDRLGVLANPTDSHSAGVHSHADDTRVAP